MKTCSQCKWAEEGDVQADLKRPYFCKRYPPTSQLVPVGHGGAQLITVSPQIQPDDYCGEWRGRDQTSETIITGR